MHAIFAHVGGGVDGGVGGICKADFDAIGEDVKAGFVEGVCGAAFDVFDADVGGGLEDVPGVVSMHAMVDIDILEAGGLAGGVGGVSMLVMADKLHLRDFDVGGEVGASSDTAIGFLV